MLAKSLLIVVSLLLLACSDHVKEQLEPQGDASTGGVGEDTAGEALIAPEGLNVAAHAGGCGVLSLTALTLRQGPKNGELYVALKNDGATPACSPAFSVQLFDKTEQPLATGLGGLLVQHFYRLTDGSDTLAACVSPGDVTMIAITDFPSDVAIDDVARLEYWCNFWSLAVAPAGDLSVSDVQAVVHDDGATYTGVLVNGLDVGLSNPSVAVFPLNRAGRPLSVALSRGAVELPPGGSWQFETSAVSELGVGEAAYAAGGP